MPESVSPKTTASPALFATAARLACVGLLHVGLLACAQESDPRAPVAATCTDGGIGVSRTIDLSLDSRPIWQQLAEKEIVLTFDDGPDPDRTAGVLDVLDKHCVKAAFFLRGDQAARYPEIVRSIVLRGHQVGGHGWAHGALLEMSIEDAREDIERSTAAVNTALAGSPETQEMTTGLFRFAYVQSNRALENIVAEMDLVPVPVHADGKDWELSAPEDIVDNVFEMLGKAGNRGVVLLHDPFNTSVQSTDLLLNRLNEAGYRIVSIQRGGE